MRHAIRGGMPWQMIGSASVISSAAMLSSTAVAKGPQP